jgi:peptidoglycan/LPS O-acetylase OafA/YrhL
MSTSPQQNTLKNSSPAETEDTTEVDRFTTEDRTGKPPKPRTGSSANLDLLRSIAVLLVLGEHLLRRNHIETIGWVHVTSLGLFGVLLFFVHTSLVLMQSMERSRLEGRPLLKNFFTRRAFRIYPLSILAVLAAVALHLDSNVNGAHGLSFGPWPGIGRIASNLLLVQNFTHSKPIVNVLWSLPYELQMYLLLPFLYLWSRKRQIFWPLIIFWVICIYPFSIQPNIHGLSRFGIINFFPNFLGGVIAFTLPRVPRIKSYLWPFFILFLVLLFTISSATITGYALCLVLGILIPSFAEISTPWLRVVSHNIATYSYGVYLSHQFCIWFALGFLGSHSPWLKVPLLVALLAGVPVLFYHSVEKPMIQVGSTLANAYASPPNDTRQPNYRNQIATSKQP